MTSTEFSSTKLVVRQFSGAEKIIPRPAFRFGHLALPGIPDTLTSVGSITYQPLRLRASTTSIGLQFPGAPCSGTSMGTGIWGPTGNDLRHFLAQVLFEVEGKPAPLKAKGPAPHSMFWELV